MNESLACERIINFYKKLIKGVMVLSQKHCINKFFNDSYGELFHKSK